jgi:hypothetical protein
MRPSIVKVCAYGFGMLLAMYPVGAAAYAPPTVAPEIDGGSVAAGIGLLSAGVLLLRARKSR